MIPTSRPGCEYGTAVYQTFGRQTPIQRCRVHKALNILERLPKPLHAAVRAVLRQAWGLDDADNRIGYRRELLKYVLKGDGPLLNKSVRASSQLFY
jgi:putative transposase